MTQWPQDCRRLTTKAVCPLVAGVMIALSLASSAASDSQTENAFEVRRDYLIHCSACHGRDGRGGPAAAMLTTRPADLTTISTRNGGVFPYEKIARIIDGREMLSSHGVREMPIWGPRFRTEEEQKSDLYPRARKVRSRIRALATYLDSLQRD